jgi:hypothetical protein
VRVTCVVTFLQEMGYTIANWNLDTEDWRVGNDPPTFLQLLVNNLRSLNHTSIIHLQVCTPVDALTTGA